MKIRKEKKEKLKRNREKSRKNKKCDRRVECDLQGPGFRFFSIFSFFVDVFVFVFKSFFIILPFF